MALLASLFLAFLTYQPITLGCPSSPSDDKSASSTTESTTISNENSLAPTTKLTTISSDIKCKFQNNRLC